MPNKSLSTPTPVQAAIVHARVAHDLASVRADLRQMDEDEETQRSAEQARAKQKVRAGLVRRAVHAVIRGASWKKEHSLNA
jgi:hypothetical protein